MSIYAGASREELADAYEDQRAFVRRCTIGSARHRRAVAALAEVAAELHDAERAAGVPVGSTREQRVATQQHEV